MRALMFELPITPDFERVQQGRLARKLEFYIGLKIGGHKRQRTGVPDGLGCLGSNGRLDPEVNEVIRCNLPIHVLVKLNVFRVIVLIVRIVQGGSRSWRLSRLDGMHRDMCVGQRLSLLHDRLGHFSLEPMDEIMGERPQADCDEDQDAGGPPPREQLKQFDDEQ
jgi:hypothetical protein